MLWSNSVYLLWSLPKTIYKLVSAYQGTYGMLSGHLHVVLIYNHRLLYSSSSLWLVTLYSCKQFSLATTFQHKVILPELSQFISPSITKVHHHFKENFPYNHQEYPHPESFADLFCIITKNEFFVVNDNFSLFLQLHHNTTEYFVGVSECIIANNINLPRFNQVSLQAIPDGNQSVLAIVFSVLPLQLRPHLPEEPLNALKILIQAS